MAELTVQALQWCVEHGHPVLALRVRDSDRFFVVAMSADDATAFAAAPAPQAGGGRDRSLTLFEATLASLGARLVGVSLHVGRDHVLQASLRLSAGGGKGEQSVPAHFADGIVLAHRARLPLQMDEADLGRVPLGPVPRPDAPQTTLAAFRDLIESLDLDGLGGPGPVDLQP